jgi:hypothetical protein
MAHSVSLHGKSYWILRKADQWQLCVGGQEQGILCSENRTDLIKVACRLGAERGAAVFIFGDQENVEARLSFSQGSLTIDGPNANAFVPELLWMQRSALARDAGNEPPDATPVVSVSSESC